MKSEQLKDTIIIQQQTVIRDSYGAEIITWTTFATVRAQVLSQTGREYFTSKQVFAEMTDIVVIRYLNGLKPKMQLILDGHVLDIMSISDIGNRHIEMHLVCKEAVI